MPDREPSKNTVGDRVLRGRDILCFSHDWTGDPLSKTHLMRVLSRDNRILWINAIANRMPTTSSKDVSRLYRKLKAVAEPVREVEPNIFVMNPFAIPAYGSPAVVKLNQKILIRQVRSAMRKLGFSNVVNMVFNPAAGMIAGKLGEEQLIYYCVDEYTAFTGSEALKEIEDDLFRRSDVVIVSAEPLLRSKQHHNANTHLIRHGTDWRHFRTAIDGDLPVPAARGRRNTHHPIATGTSRLSRTPIMALVSSGRSAMNSDPMTSRGRPTPR